jgi:hypothetical protein
VVFKKEKNNCIQKKCLLLFFLSILNLNVFGQSFPKNSFKFNAASFATGLYSVQLERKLSKHWSFNNTFFYREKSLIPLGDQIDNVAKKHGIGLTGIKFEYIFMNEAQLGVWGYSPEFRYYFGNKKHRLFLGGFGQFEKFDMSVPALLAATARGQFFDIKAPIDFQFQTLSGGLLIGKQFKWKRVGFDFVILGPHFGKANKFLADASTDLLQELNDQDRQYLRDKIIERFGLSGNYFNLTIDEQQALVTSKKPIPYFGIRGLGVNVFIEF